MGVYGVEWAREAHRGTGDHGCTAILWMMEWWKVLRRRYQRRRGYSSRTMTPNTPLKSQHSGLRTMTSKCLSGLPNPLILTLLSTSGCIRAMLHYPTPPKGVHELWDRLVEEWNKIPPETC